MTDPHPAAARQVSPPRALHLAALTTLAIAQPLFDLLARHAEIFVVRRLEAGEILALTAVLLLLPPALLLALREIARRLRPGLGSAVHHAAVAGLAALLAFQVLQRLGLDGGAWLAAGLVAGGLWAALYRKSPAMRLFHTFLAASLLVAPAVFLLRPAIRQLTAGAPRAASQASGAHTPIVFLILDELSLAPLLGADGRIDAEIFPRLAAFAEEATFFTNAATPSGATETAVPAILTGRFPRPEQLPTVADHPQNLCTLFGDYSIRAQEPITRLCPPAANASAIHEAAAPGFVAFLLDLGVVYAHLVLPPREAGRLPSLEGRWQGFVTRGPAPPPEELSAGGLRAKILAALDRDRLGEFERFLAALDPAKDEALYLLHWLLPHTPWEFLPDGRSYQTPRDRIPGLVDGHWGHETSPVIQAYFRYLLQVQFLDRRLGDLFDRLREIGLYDRALIVLVADHGVSFRPGQPRREVTFENFADLIPVPLWIKAPGQQAGRYVARPVSTLDILPSVLELAGVEPPQPLDGVSLFTPAADSAPRRFFVGTDVYDIPEDLPALLDTAGLPPVRQVLASGQWPPEN